MEHTEKDDHLGAVHTLIGETINNYRLVSALGEGGMGAVYLAEHPFMGRKAAVKVLRREFAEDAGIVERFMNEARAANAIHHPNIIDIIDVGKMPSGIPYLMMELLEGESLARRIERLKRLALADAIDIAVQTAAALEAAHGKGIVHRDLKPDNLFLVPDESQPRHERVKVLDFGIAKLRGDLSGSGAKTQSGSLMGTPPYMSPEQCRGLSDEIDHRTDVYALGIILYEMLCGKPPFVSAGWGEIVLMHITRAPDPLRSHNPAVPEALEAVVLKALAKEPAERFASMRALSEALRAVSVARVTGAASASPSGADAMPGGTVMFPASTTLKSSAGQIDYPSSTASGAGSAARGRSRWVISGAATLAVVAIGAVVLSRVGGGSRARREETAAAAIGTSTAAAMPPPAAPNPAPAPVEPPAAPARQAGVLLRLRSEPPGAAVSDEKSGDSLGVTPLELRQPRGPGALELRLTKEGFAPARLSVPLDGDAERTVALARQHDRTKKSAERQVGAGPSRPAVARTPAPVPAPAPGPTPTPRAEKW